jgi:hypothetical protein
MEFDTADLGALQQSGQLQSVILHEMGHVLGIGTIWTDKGLLSGAGTNDPIFTGLNATAQYNQIFGTNAPGVPVENMGGPGTAGAHWRESILDNELMTGYLNNGTNPLSRITVGSLADLGYTVNYAAADPYTKPGGLAAPLTIGGSSAALRSGFVRLTIPDGLSANSFAFSALGAAAYVDPRPSAQVATASAPISANLADSVIEQTGASTDSSSMHRLVYEHEHNADEADQLWSEVATGGWNPLLQLAFT